MARYDRTYAKWPYLILLALLTSSGLGGGVHDGLQELLVDDNSNNASYTAHISNIESTQLFARQQKTCSLPMPWYSCADGVHCCSTADRCLPDSCCPRESVVCNTRVCLEPGSTCCGDTGCPLGTTCRTIEGKTGCCPRTAETCGGTACLSAGQTCCGDGACKNGAFCRKSSNGRYTCCPSSDDVACDDKTCCRAGYTCVAGECMRPTTEISTSTSKSTSKSTSESAPTSISYSLSSGTSTSTYTTGMTSTSKIQTSTCTSTPGSAPTGIGAWDWISVDGERDCVPVLDFYCVEGLFDQLCASMCTGIREQAAGRVLSDMSILLHRREGRKAASGCHKKGCADRRTYISLYNRYFSMQCDEFPPASTTEGGGPSLTCVAWYQNGLGGIYLQRFYADLGLKQDDPFVIRMDTCDLPSQPVSYPAGEEPTLPMNKRAVEDPSWFDLSSRHSNYGFIIGPLSDISAGPHEGTLAFLDSTVGVRAAVVDGSGNSYWTLGDDFDENGGPVSVSYVLDDDVDDAFLAVAATSSVAISADFTTTEPIDAAPTSKAPNLDSVSAAGADAWGAGIAQQVLATVMVTVVIIRLV